MTSRLVSNVIIDNLATFLSIFPTKCLLDSSYTIPKLLQYSNWSLGNPLQSLFRENLNTFNWVFNSSERKYLLEHGKHLVCKNITKQRQNFMMTFAHCSAFYLFYATLTFLTKTWTRMFMNLFCFRSDWQCLLYNFPSLNKTCRNSSFIRERILK